MSNVWGRNGGVYLGFGSDETSGPAPPLDAPLCYVGDRHIVSIGPNGSGKTRRLLLPNLVRLHEWSILVVDPKGELAAMTAGHRLEAGSDVVFLNPFNVFGMGSNGFNPIAALDPGTPKQPGDDFPDDALGLAEAMIRVSAKDPHWGQAAQELIAALIMYVRLTEKKPGEGSLRDVRALQRDHASEQRNEQRAFHGADANALARQPADESRSRRRRLRFLAHEAAAGDGLSHSAGAPDGDAQHLAPADDHLDHPAADERCPGGGGPGPVHAR
jgi:type IV secretory pathway TraG/TraD family ATPase VirD4